jgi:hypothetical protein
VKVSAGLQSSYAAGHAFGDATAFVPRSARGARGICRRHAAPRGVELNRRSGRIVLLDGAHGDAHVSGVFAVGRSIGDRGTCRDTGLSVIYLTPYLMILRCGSIAQRSRHCCCAITSSETRQKIATPG